MKTSILLNRSEKVGQTSRVGRVLLAPIVYQAVQPLSGFFYGLLMFPNVFQCALMIMLSATFTSFKTMTLLLVSFDM